MNKDIRGKLAIINCLLLMLPSLAWADESKAVTEEGTTLDEVVVSAVPLEKYLVTTSVITDKDIEAKGARNLTEVLEDVPGLNLHKGRKGNTAVEIRGLSSSEVKIYIDGVLVNPLAKMTSSAAVDTSMIPVDNIAKIEIIKGPAPVIYGADAKGGVILITTKNGSTNQGGATSLLPLALGGHRMLRCPMAVAIKNSIIILMPLLNVLMVIGIMKMTLSTLIRN